MEKRKTTESAMRIEEFQSMSSEIATLQDLLNEIPEDDVIDRRSILARLEGAKARLPNQNEVEWRERARAVLTFRGRPVDGTRGIRADFGTKATAVFVDVVAAIAASLDGPLKATGPIPDRNENHMLIVGTAVGSFGFELESGQPSRLTFGEDKTNTELALTRAITLFRASVDQDNEALADNIDDLDKRALAKVRDFVTTLAEADATCALVFEGNRFDFQSTALVQYAANRLSNNVTTSEATIEGAITGVIPSQRTFEFTRTGGELIVGKIGPEILSPSELNGMLKKPMSILASITTVGGSKPRYVLHQVLEPTQRLLG
jgi:hypothetical protein